MIKSEKVFFRVDFTDRKELIESHVNGGCLMEELLDLMNERTPNVKFSMTPKIGFVYLPDVIVEYIGPNNRDWATNGKFKNVMKINYTNTDEVKGAIFLHFN